LDFSIDVIRLLMNLSANNYTPSSQIREQYSQEEYSRLNYLLSDLFKKGYIKKRRPQILKPGGDKLEYMLDKNGSKLRDSLIQKIFEIILLNKTKSKKILKDVLSKEGDVVGKIVSDISEEISEYYEGKMPTKLQKNIRNIINRDLF